MSGPIVHKGNPRVQEVFTTGQVAKLCKVAPRTVSKWFDTGKLKGYRIPGSEDRRIPRDSLVRFLKVHNMPLGRLSEDTGPKVFLVGHTTGDAATLAAVLTGGGCNVTPFGDDWFAVGVEFNQSPPDCIVLDGSLGTAQVFRFAQRIRQWEKESGLSKRFNCLLVLVAGADDTDHERFRQAGIDKVVTHPADGNAILGGIQDVIHARENY